MAVIEIKGSKVDPYRVDTEELTCTCPDFIHRRKYFSTENPERLCKHLCKVFEDNPNLKPSYLKKLDMIETSGVENQDGKVRYPRSIVDFYVEDLKSILRSFSQNIIEKYEICGSYRRLASYVSDIDVLLTLSKGASLTSLKNYFELVPYEILWGGELKMSMIMENFIQVDFKVVTESSWPFALCHFTGSKGENLRLRRRANDLGYSLSEYGLRHLKDPNSEYFNFEITSEEGVYKFLNLPYKAPWDR